MFGERKWRIKMGKHKDVLIKIITDVEETQKLPKICSFFDKVYASIYYIFQKRNHQNA